MTSVRAPAVAGSFDPADPGELRATVSRLLRATSRSAAESAAIPKALIVPHAGYEFSGPVAASGYARLLPAREAVRRVALLGPAHFAPLEGIAAPSVEAFAAPLGELPLDRETIEALAATGQIAIADAPHAREHSLEVQLPFLQAVLEDPLLVPLVVGNASADDVADTIDALWDGNETVIVVSTDLSHYAPYEVARERDAATARIIEELDLEKLRPDAACGFFALRGLLLAARRRGLRAHRLDLRNSGDTAGSHERVVGYGAFAFAG